MSSILMRCVCFDLETETVAYFLENARKNEVFTILTWKKYNILQCLVVVVGGFLSIKIIKIKRSKILGIL